MEGKKINELEHVLSDRYPVEATYGSRANLWMCGKVDGVISEKQFEEAKKYYGKFWHQIGV